LLFGLTLLIQQAFDNQLSTWSGGVEMIVYVDHGSNQDQIDLVYAELTRQTTVIESVEYCDEACTYADAHSGCSPGDPSALELLTPEIIPSSFKVKPVDKDSSEVLASLTESFASLPNVFDVRTPEQAVKVLGELQGFFGVRTLVIAIGLLVRVGAAHLEHHPHCDVRAPSRDRGDEARGCHQLVHPRCRSCSRACSRASSAACSAAPGCCTSTTTGRPACSRSPATRAWPAFVVTDSYPLWVCFWMILLGGFVGAVGSATAASRFLDV
jgi:cell division transport system permease protein